MTGNSLGQGCMGPGPGTTFSSTLAAARVSWPIHPISWAGPSSGRPTCFRDAQAPLTHSPSIVCPRRMPVMPALAVQTEESEYSPLILPPRPPCLR